LTILVRIFLGKLAKLLMGINRFGLWKSPFLQENKMSTKLLAGLLAMVVVAGVGIYTGVTKFYAPEATAINSDSPCCASKAKEAVAKLSCCSEEHHEEEAATCCAAKAGSKTPLIGACVGGAGLHAELKASGCAKCKEDHCEEK
jgi:hypothetical protein